MKGRYLTNSAGETKRLAKKLVKNLKKPLTVIALYGDLGSGKTTFVKGLAKGLGIKKRIVSPTFIFIREYEVRRWKKRAKETPKSFATEQAPPRWPEGTPRMVEELASTKFLYHIDLYRIERLEDTRGLGLEEILTNPQNIVAIEWAEKIKKILPKKRIEVYFKYLEDNKRKIIVNFLGFKDEKNLFLT